MADDDDKKVVGVGMARITDTPAPIFISVTIVAGMATNGRNPGKYRPSSSCTPQFPTYV